MKNLKHPCIPQIYDIEEDKNALYIVEQYIEGVSLKSICQNRKLQEKTILSYATQICDLIYYLHTREEPILYLDLKPENILVHKDCIYLVDFGTSRNKFKSEKDNFGTPWFAAPEQYINYKTDERADIYGIGMLLYYMAFGKEYMKDKGRNIDASSNCSKNLKRIINRCIKLHPYQRYSSVRELQKQISKLKYKSKKKSDHIITIALVGACHRIGVTHIALQFASFLIGQKYAAIYLECNESHALSSMAKRNSDTCCQRNGYRLYDVPCDIYGEKREYDWILNYQFAIMDYGVLTSENVLDIQKADYCILIMGAKDWELDAAEESLKLSSNIKDMCYLFNFISAHDFRKVQCNMLGKRCYRVPFEPQLFSRKKVLQVNNKGIMDSLFSELLQEITEEKGAK